MKVSDGFMAVIIATEVIRRTYQRSLGGLSEVVVVAQQRIMAGGGIEGVANDNVPSLDLLQWLY